MTPAAPPAGGPQEAATPGQAAYEAWLPNGPVAWEYADSDVRAAWDAAADAANRVSLARVLAECARYKAERDDYAEEMIQLRLDVSSAAERADRYRAALERIRDHEPPLIAGVARQIARAALGEAAP